MQYVIVRRLRWLTFAVSAMFCLSLVPSVQAQTPAPPPPVPLEQLDVTNNDYINATDAVRIISAWTELQQSGDPCSSAFFAHYDVDENGCIDVVDAQLVASQVGKISGPKGALLSNGVVGAVDSGATFVVKSDGNEPDTNTGDGQCTTAEGTCTLRAAIQESNILAGHETINFDIKKNGTYPDVLTIYPQLYTLPTGDDDPNESWLDIDDARNNGITINGYSQPGASENTTAVPNNAKIIVEVKGRQQLRVHGIRIGSANNVIKGLAFYGWDRQIFLESVYAVHNHIEGNFIGSNATLTWKQRNMGTHHSEGIRLQYGASYNAIGCGDFAAAQWVPCTDLVRVNAARNIVIGNGNDGIHLERSPVTNNHIAGNWIGVKQDGKTSTFESKYPDSQLGNGKDAIDFEQGVQNNWLGGETEAERNVISGNGSEGIEISHGLDTQYNRVVGNYFGLDATGTQGVRNCGNGISFEDTPSYNYAYNNVVGHNWGSGVRVYRRSTYNEIFNNLIGVAADGVTPMPNGIEDAFCRSKEQIADYGGSGVFITGGGQHNIVRNNVIANHPENGVKITVLTVEEGDKQTYGSVQQTDYNMISQNTIYNNAKAGIYFDNRNSTKANRGMEAPVLFDATSRSVSGTACANCTIEVFVADKTSVGGSENAGEGKTFIGSGVANGAGAFTVQTSDTALGVILTATGTDAEGNTSQFSKNVAVTQDVSATETVVAATANAQATTSAATMQAQASATALIVQATADAEATTVAATAQAGATQTTIMLQTEPALAATATAQADQTATAQAGQTATAIAIATDPALAGTATALAQAPDTYRVMLPLMAR